METIITGKIIKVGDSLAVIIQKPIVSALHLQRGDRVVFGVPDDSTVFVRKLSDAQLREMRVRTIKSGTGFSIDG